MSVFQKLFGLVSGRFPVTQRRSLQIGGMQAAGHEKNILSCNNGVVQPTPFCVLFLKFV